MTKTAPLKLRLLTLTSLVILLDQWSKLWIEERVGYDRIEVIEGFFNIINVQNTGVAFGLFPARGSLLGTMIIAALGVVALTVVTVYYLRTPSDQRGLLTALAFVLGGAVGNITDRLMNGAVTDFLEFSLGAYRWPTFNVADSAISVGIVLMAFQILRPEPAPATASAES